MQTLPFKTATEFYRFKKSKLRTEQKNHDPHNEHKQSEREDDKNNLAGSVENDDRKWLKSKPPCRFERRIVKIFPSDVIGRPFIPEVEFILDVAHNVTALENLFTHLSRMNMTQFKDVHIICGFSAGKDITENTRVVVSGLYFINL